MMMSLSAFSQSEQLELITDSAMVEEINSNNNDSMGVVIYVFFVVTKEGEITRVKVQSVTCDPCLKTHYCDKKYIKALKKEALRVVKDMESWKPAIVEDERVDSQFILPIRFID